MNFHSMRKSFILSAILGCAVIASAQDNDPSASGVIAIIPDETYPASATVPVVEHLEKSIYIPADLRKLDLNDPDSKWSFHRMVSTPDIVLFWDKGFGPDISKAPDLDGNNMKVDLANLLAKLGRFYDFFYYDLGFAKPGSKADRYKMMVMLDYSLEGTAYGGDYDGQIGALWIAPNRVQDSNLNCIAHELGHSFQLQITCDGEGEAWGGSGFYEMASQWMLWQVNPEWQKDERFHLEAFADLTHKAFLHIDNIYHSPYVLELWGEKHGRPFIAELFRQGKVGEDPAMTYMRLTGLSQEQFNDEMWHNYARLVNWDIDRVRDYTRGYTDIWHTDLVDADGGWKRVAPGNAPENYGFNVIPVDVPAPGKTVTVDFRGEAGRKGYYTLNRNKAGWRYGLVAIDSKGGAIYGDMEKARNGKVSFMTPAEGGIEKLWLVVMGAPTEHWRNVDGHDNPGDAQWPYSIKIVSRQ